MTKCTNVTYVYKSFILLRMQSPLILRVIVRVMVFNATFNNISVTSTIVVVSFKGGESRSTRGKLLI
jgi:hypothetical protein